jgi:hypothetical protein
MQPSLKQLRQSLVTAMSRRIVRLKRAMVSIKAH